MARKTKPVKAYDENGELVGEYPSLAEAERELGVPSSRISECIRFERTSKGYSFEAVNPDDFIPGKKGGLVISSTHKEVTKEIESYPPMHQQTPEQLREYKALLERRLNDQQKEFCQEYIYGDAVGDGMKAYQVVYGTEDRIQASKNASDALNKKHVLDYINYLMYEAGWNAPDVDTQLMYLIKQERDFSVKLGAIKEFNKIHGRITDKLEISDGRNPVDLSVLSDEELDMYIKLHSKATGDRNIEDAEYEIIND